MGADRPSVHKDRPINQWEQPHAQTRARKTGPQTSGNTQNPAKPAGENEENRMLEIENTSPAAQEAGAEEADGWDDPEGLEGLEDGFDGDAAQDGAGEPADDAGAADATASDEAGAKPGGEAAESAGAAPKKEPEYPIIYNGQEMQLPVSQLTKLAQQGMNYAPVYERMTAAEALAAQQAPMVALVEQLAALSGMPLEQYLVQGPGLLEQGFVSQQTAAGVPEAAARQMWQDKLRLAALESGGRLRAAAEARQKSESEAEAAQRAEFEAFIREYPEVQRLPDEVIEIKRRTGESVTSAYRKWELGQLKAQMAAQKAEQQNRLRAPASAAGVGKKAETDAFADGWDSAY